MRIFMSESEAVRAFLRGELIWYFFKEEDYTQASGIQRDPDALAEQSARDAYRGLSRAIRKERWGTAPRTEVIYYRISH